MCSCGLHITYNITEDYFWANQIYGKLDYTKYASWRTLFTQNSIILLDSDRKQNAHMVKPKYLTYTSRFSEWLSRVTTSGREVWGGVTPLIKGWNWDTYVTYSQARGVRGLFNILRDGSGRSRRLRMRCGYVTAPARCLRVHDCISKPKYYVKQHTNYSLCMVFVRNKIYE